MELVIVTLVAILLTIALSGGSEDTVGEYSHYYPGGNNNAELDTSGSGFKGFIRRTITDPVSFFTLVLTFATIATAWIVFGQLRATQKSNEAFISAEEGSLAPVDLQYDGGETPPKIDFGFLNIGRGPAIILYMEHRKVVVGPLDKIPKPPFPKYTEPSTHVPVVGGGRLTTIEQRDVKPQIKPCRHTTAEEAKKISEGHTLIFQTCVVYETMLGRIYRRVDTSVHKPGSGEEVAGFRPNVKKGYRSHDRIA